MSSGSKNDVVESLYDAALGQRTWGDASRSLVSSLDGLTLNLIVHHRKSPVVELVSSVGTSPEHLLLYSERFAQHDLWALGALDQRLFGRAMIGSQVVEDRVLERSLIYNEFLRPIANVHHLAGAILALDDGHYAVVGVHRPRDAKAYEPKEIHRLGLLLPHLQRALEIRQRLRQAEAISRSAAAAFDRLSLGVILMGPTGKLLHVNAAADVMLRAGDGLMRVPDGIRAMAKQDDRRLQELIVGARRTSGSMTATPLPGGHVRIGRPSGQQAYAVMVAPVGPSGDGGKSIASVLVFVSDPGPELVSDLAILKELFGFPPSEARLVLALLNGMAPPDFARQARLSYHTVRTLLARAMDRTDTRSQLELVLLVARSLKGMAAKSPSRS
jgi:DNA-binding CsgD family transcriptional regulator